MLIRLGSRGSRLALTQAELVADALRSARPDVDVAIVPITTAGDRDRSKPFGEIGARGVFVKELEEALLGGRIDLAVHSAKDMTSTDADGLAIGAYLPREDPRDALCGADELRPGMRIGTASVRRRAQLLVARAEPLGGAAARERRHAPAQARRARARRDRARRGRARAARARCGDRQALRPGGDPAGGGSGRPGAPGPRRRGGAGRGARRRRDPPARPGGARLRRAHRRRLPRARGRLPRRRAPHRARRGRGRRLDRAAQRRRPGRRSPTSCSPPPPRCAHEGRPHRHGAALGPARGRPRGTRARGRDLPAGGRRGARRPAASRRRVRLAAADEP